MNRETRRANLRKLQLPGSSTDTGHLRRTRSATTPSISNYFATPQKPESQKACSQVESISTKNTQSKIAQEKLNKKETETASGNEPNGTAKAKRLKRTKLTGFLCKEKTEVLPFNRACSVDDFVTPAKKIKKAPKLKKTASSRTTKSRSNRQPSIQSAFLRNEQMFAEITAQHCLADDVSPDDMQMALAISQSEVTMQNERKSRADEDIVVDILAVGDSPAKEHQVQESIRSKLQKYGFQTAARENYNNLAALFQPVAAERRSKCKWASKFTTLTLRNRDIQAQRLKQRIEDFLRQQCKTRTLSASEASPCPYFLLSSTLKKFEVPKHEQIIKPIVTCEPVTTDDAATAEAIESLECFFVTELFEVTHVRAGHLLKKWERIPGRDLSPQARSKESEVMEIRLQCVYEKLEETFPKAARIPSGITNEASSAEMTESVKSKAHITNHTLSTKITGICDRNPTEKSDLDHIIQLIKEYNEGKCSSRKDSLAGTTQAETEETPEKKRKLNQLNNNECSADRSFIRNAQAYSPHCSGRVSPDLFGDSDLDVEKEKSACDISLDCVSSTFEASRNSIDFKSEHLTKTLATNPVIDLTQEDVQDGIVNSSCSVSMTEFDDPAKGGASKHMFYEHFNIIDSHNVKSPPKTLDTLPRIRSKSNSLKLVAHIPRDSANTFAEIDLLSLSDEEEDTVWTDNTALALHEFGSQDKLNCSSTSSCDADSLSMRYAEPVQTAHEFSFVDLIADDEPKPFSKTAFTETNSSVSVDVDVEPIPSQCFATPHKCGQSDSKLAESLMNWSRERAEFGILDSHSEPFTQSPYTSPRTPTRTVAVAAVNDLAFSQPPSPESTTPMKNSRNSQKFSELLKAIGNDPIDSTAAQNAAYNMFDDTPKLTHTFDEPRQPVALISLDDSYDDIDKLIYGTPKRKPSVDGPKEPAGLEQLLTAELRFQQDRTPIKLQTPYRCSQETVPTAATLDFTEQLEINGQTYNVRLATTPKPDFTKQTESELQRQLYKYGIKLLPRNKAVKLLEHIYNQTHPTIVLEDEQRRR